MKNTQRRIQNSPSFKNGIAQNREPIPRFRQIESAYKKPSIAKTLFELFVLPNHPKNIPSIKSCLKNIQGDYFVWLGHSSCLLHIKNLFFLIDPLFKENGSPFAWINVPFKGSTPFSLSDLPPITHLIITHNHYDHLSKYTIKALSQQQIQQAIVPLGIGKYLKSWGIPEKNIIELDWEESICIAENIELFCLTARHFSGRKLVDMNKTLWASFLLQTNKRKIYFSGDGGYGVHFKSIGERFKHIDLAFIENGQYSKDWPFAHMFPHQTFQAAKDLNAKFLMPIHNSKYKLSLHNPNEPLSELYKLLHKEQSLKLITPIIGQVVPLWDSQSAENIESMQFDTWWEQLGG
ncbi:MBL fold metallo-hydrolase [Helicobacter monodelphidis]|uniref:MBL fold metallo-hydrolase n=1 Tax=Helicobacter sp. 15-1451 TaxID=2004995 RepID=UPI0015EC8A1C|nr:MBL fold metallo-hydrolase [Helicobacter sp. 15-1451]